MTFFQMAWKWEGAMMPTTWPMLWVECLIFGWRCPEFPTRKMAQGWNFSTRIAIQVHSFSCLYHCFSCLFLVSYLYMGVQWCNTHTKGLTSWNDFAICLGKDFTYWRMKILSIAFLRFFHFKLADDTKPVHYRAMLTLHIDGALPLCAVPRTI